MSVTWRDVTPADAGLLASLGAQTFTETFGHLYSPENLNAFLANHSEEQWFSELSDPAFAVRIGMAGHEPAAYAKLGPPSLPFEPRGTPIELRQFYIRSQWQGAGLAPELMDWVLGEARRRGADELFLSVFIDNARARRFYARYGFEPVGRYDFMVGTHADEDIVMRKAL